MKDHGMVFESPWGAGLLAHDPTVGPLVAPGVGDHEPAVETVIPAGNQTTGAGGVAGLRPLRPDPPVVLVVGGAVVDHLVAAPWRP